MNIQLFDYSVNLLQVILWQYDESPNTLSLLTQKQNWYNTNQTQFWTDWYNNVFNLLTADVFGLAVWSFILELPLFIPPNPDSPTKPVWGFNAVTVFPSYENSYTNFTRGNFSTTKNTITLTVEEQRLVLRLKYFKLVSRGAIPEINSFLNYLFSTSGGPEFTGGGWVLDGFDMTMTYVFNFNMSTELFEVLKGYDLLPRPAGVRLKYVFVNRKVFGFGLNNQNFGNGNFITIDSATL